MKNIPNLGDLSLADLKGNAARQRGSVHSKSKRAGNVKSLGWNSATEHSAQLRRIHKPRSSTGAFIEKRNKARKRFLRQTGQSATEPCEGASKTPSEKAKLDASGGTKPSEEHHAQQCRKPGGFVFARNPDCKVLTSVGCEVDDEDEEEDAEEEEEPRRRVERVQGWAQKYKEKEARLCTRKCPNCPTVCYQEHPEGTNCPPCMLEDMPSFGILAEDTANESPVVLRVARKRYSNRVLHRLLPWSFPLKGQPCSFISIVEFGGSYTDATNMWSGDFHRLLIWSLETHGFDDDQAIVDIFSRVHETTYDLAEERGEQLEKIPMEELSPAYKVAVIVSWGGRVKIAEQWKNEEIVMVGENQVGPGRSYKVMCYGQAHAEVCIREGKVCNKDVFVMVPKGIKRERLFSVAKKHGGDVTQMAQELIKFEDIKDCTWVLKFA